MNWATMIAKIMMMIVRNLLPGHVQSDDEDSVEKDESHTSYVAQLRLPRR